MAAASQMGLSGILKSNCISGRESGARIFLRLPLTIFEKCLAIERYQILLPTERVGVFNLVLEAFRFFLSPNLSKLLREGNEKERKR